MEKHYVIAGGSAAGMAAAHTIRKHDPGGAVTVLSDEPDLPYFRPMIPYIVNGKKQVTDIGLTGSGIFVERGIDVVLSDSVARVDTAEKAVRTASGKSYHYNKILFATGSRPYMPETIGHLDTPGVFAMKKLRDAAAMAKRAGETEHAVMLGGGILNLKAAFALLERGIRVSLVVYSPEVLSQLMDPEDAVLVRQALDGAGLTIITGCSAVKVISRGGGVSAVALDNGTELPCQMVCVGKGVVPNTDFLDPETLRVEGGIETDPFTRASAPDTFAAGDVAVTHDPATGEKTVTALWTNAVEMGICAGRNMAGLPTRYAGTLGIMNATQVADLPFVAMGMVHTRGRDLEVHRDETGGGLRKMVFDPSGEHLVGALFIGDITHAGLYRYLIREKKKVGGIKHHLIRQTLHYGHFM